MRKSVSFLLGAGFSAPMGYPIGNDLNKKLLECNSDKFGFSAAGGLIVSNDGTKPNLGYKTNYDFEFDFCRDLIQHFNKVKGYFDYEEFYDFFNHDANADKEVENLFLSNKYGDHNSLRQILSAIKNIYTHLIGYFLVDGEGKSWYDTEPYALGPTWQGYTGILNCLKMLGENNIVNVHTLNHDLFFERLNNSEWIKGELSDGFEELGSPYYGNLSSAGRNYLCRLQYFTGKYLTNFRLFKLHGSKDYGVYYNTNESVMTPDKYIKTRWGIGFGELMKEIRDKNGNLSYENCWVNYHADFLTGTTSKIERYKEPLLFKILFENFRKNLQDSEKLIIIGYGGRDAEVNKMILENYNFAEKPSYIIDPFPGKAINDLKKNIGATLIEKHLEYLKIDDLE